MAPMQEEIRVNQKAPFEDAVLHGGVPVLPQCHLSSTPRLSHRPGKFRRKTLLNPDHTCQR